MRVREEKEKKKSETRASPLTGEMLVSGGKEGGSLRNCRMWVKRDVTRLRVLTDAQLK